MLKNIKYVYGKDRDNQDQLLGAKVYTFAEGALYRPHQIYVGMEFCLEDIINNKINQKAIGIGNIDEFLRRYELCGASGIIFFPQVDSYGFLEPGDRVIDWNYDMNLEETLSEEAQLYSPTVEELAKKSPIIDFLDVDDTMLEIFDMPTESVDMRVSSR